MSQEDPTQTGASSETGKPASETSQELEALENQDALDSGSETESTEQKDSDTEHSRESTTRDRKMAEAIAARTAELSDFETEARTHPREHEQHNQVSDDPENNQNEDQHEKLDTKVSIEEDTDEREQSAPDDLLKDLHIYMKDGVPTMTLVVQGEELELPVDRVRGIAQKNFLADNRLRKAAETEKSLAEREADIQRREKELQESRTYLPDKPGVKSDDALGVKDRAAAFIQTLFNGTEEEAIERAAEFLSGNSSTFDTEALRQELETAAEKRALEALERREQERVQNWLDQDLARGVAIVERDYPQVLSDDVLYAAADGLTDSIQDANPDWTPSQVLVEAAKRVTERLGTPARQDKESPAETQTHVSVTTQKDRKAELKPVPQSRSNARFETPREPEVDHSPGAVIERMKAARNQIAGR